jgi:AcrR family transcriptional regulator
MTVVKALVAPSRRRRGEALEGAICAAALDELRRAGYSGFTVDGVAARAHTGKASIYRRWPDKAQLVADAICRAMPRPEGTTLAADLPSSVSTRDALVRMFDSIASGMSRVATDSLRCIIAEVARNPALADVMTASVLCPRQRGLLDLLRRGIALGDVRPDAPMDLLAELIPGLMIKRVVMRTEPLLDRRTIVQLVDEVIMPILAPGDDHRRQPASARGRRAG